MISNWERVLLNANQLPQSTEEKLYMIVLQNTKSWSDPLLQVVLFAGICKQPHDWVLLEKEFRGFTDEQISTYK